MRGSVEMLNTLGIIVAIYTAILICCVFIYYKLSEKED